MLAGSLRAHTGRSRTRRTSSHCRRGPPSELDGGTSRNLGKWEAASSVPPSSLRLHLQGLLALPDPRPLLSVAEFGWPCRPRRFVRGEGPRPCNARASSRPSPRTHALGAGTRPRGAGRRPSSDSPTDCAAQSGLPPIFRNAQYIAQHPSGSRNDEPPGRQCFAGSALAPWRFIPVFQLTPVVRSRFSVCSRVLPRPNNRPSLVVAWSLRFIGSSRTARVQALWTAQRVRGWQSVQSASGRK